MSLQPLAKECRSQTSQHWRVRRAEYICHLPDAVIRMVLQRLGSLLDPEQL
jgi:hypothetical protein